MLAMTIGEFLHYYQYLGARVLPGSSLVDPAIPQSFVMSAGLAHFEGASYDRLPEGVNQYALCQNCFRYFDIERVEGSVYHLSLFKMLGAFYFGCVERELAISRLWQLLINFYGIDAKRLWVTYYGGGRVNEYPLMADEEAKMAWIKMGIPSEKIRGLDPQHSFWKQSRSTVGNESAPKCGEYTEVYFDFGEEYSCGEKCGPGCGCGRFIEFASILFIAHQMDDSPGSLSALPLPFSETVIGVERLAMLIQGVNTVFDIEALKPLSKLIDDFTRYSGDVSFFDPEVSRQVIIDHLRAVLFLAADGAPSPGKGGRRRIVRKLIRRTLTHMQLLGIAWDSDFLPAFYDALVNLCDEPLPYLSRGRARALEFYDLEQGRFGKTLAMTERSIDRIVQGSEALISGHQMLVLVKKRGMPLPLVRDYCSQRGIALDEQDYWLAYRSWQEEEG